MKAEHDMRTDDPTRAMVQTHICHWSGSLTIARPAYQMSAIRWGTDLSDRLCLYMFAADGVTALAYLPTPEEMVATGKVLVASGEAALARAEREAADALAKARR